MVCWRDGVYLFGDDSFPRYIWKFDITSKSWDRVSADFESLDAPAIRRTPSTFVPRTGTVYFLTSDFDGIYIHAYNISSRHWWIEFQKPNAGWVSVGFLVALVPDTKFAFSFGNDYKTYHAIYDTLTGDYKEIDMTTINPFSAPFLSSISAQPLDAETVILVYSGKQISFILEQADDAKIGSAVAWDLSSNKLTPFDRPLRGLAITPPLFMNPISGSLLITGSSFSPQVEGVSILSFDRSAGCPPGSCTGANSCYKGLYCQCQNPAAANGNCELQCDGCRGYCYERSNTANPAGPTMCICPYGFAGEHCDIPFPCLGGVVSLQANGSAECTCIDDHYGDACEQSATILVLSV